jgi:CRISPR-associated protein (TIGR03986 family)
MTLPRHCEKIPSHRVASAPYNFVPLPDKIVPAVSSPEELPRHDRFVPGRHSGHFEVSLTTLSPLFTRGPLTLGEFERMEQQGEATPYFDKLKNKADFFTLNAGKPVIPGSSLRGMLRAILEVVTYSKMTQVNEGQIVHRAVADTSSVGDDYRKRVLQELPLPPGQNGGFHFSYPSPNIQAGYIEEQGGQWFIRPAQKPGGHGESFVRVEHNNLQAVGLNLNALRHRAPRDVHVLPVARAVSNRTGHNQPLSLTVAVTPDVKMAPGPGLVPAKLVVSGHMNGKHWHAAVFEPDASATLIAVPDEMRRTYLDDFEFTREATRPLRSGSPVFYLMEGGALTFFGATVMMRLPYKNTVKKLIPAELRDPGKIDFAEAIFGFIRNDEELKQADIAVEQGHPARSYGGRVYVTNAAMTSPGERRLQTLTPRILSGPKPSSFQLYLVQPSHDEGGLKHYDDIGQTVPRGQKMYWHWDDKVGASDYAEDVDKLDAEGHALDDNGNPSKQHTQICPVDTGTEFRFKIHFHNLSDEELGALCWTLHPFDGGEPGAEYAHKLGMGKPLGLGSVRLQATLHRLNRARRYRTLFASTGDRWASPRPRPQDLGERENLEYYVQPFETFMHERLGHPERIKFLFQTRRIASLLKMMQWPGQPAHADGDICLPRRPNTRYMEIERDGVPPNEKNEYKRRRVLPTPGAFGPLTGDYDHEEPVELQQVVARPTQAVESVTMIAEPTQTGGGNTMQAVVKTNDNTDIVCFGFRATARASEHWNSDDPIDRRLQATVTREGGVAKQARFTSW